MAMTQNHFWNTDKQILLGLKQCFTQNFTQWLEKSNHPHISSLRKGIRISFLPITELEALQEILDVILVEPDADYFWYNHSGKLTYSLPHHEVVPSGSIRIDSDKVKMLLRDIKINQIFE